MCFISPLCLRFWTCRPTMSSVCNVAITSPPPGPTSGVCLIVTISGGAWQTRRSRGPSWLRPPLVRPHWVARIAHNNGTELSSKALSLMTTREHSGAPSERGRCQSQWQSGPVAPLCCLSCACLSPRALEVPCGLLWELCLASEIRPLGVQRAGATIQGAVGAGRATT